MRRLGVGAFALTATVALAACGSSAGLIPRDSANKLTSDLAAIQTAFVEGHCTIATAKVASAQIDALNLPATVNQRLADQLNQGLRKLLADTQRECQNATGGSTSTTGSSSSTGATGQTGSTGSTSTSSSSSSTSSTTSSTSSSTTSTTSTSTSSSTTGPTCTSTTGGNGGTPACDGSTATGGIGGAGLGGGTTGTGAASVGN